MRLIADDEQGRDLGRALVLIPGGRVGERATKCGPLSPRRTGDADFPRPALLKALASGVRSARKADQPQLRQML